MRVEARQPVAPRVLHLRNRGRARSAEAPGASRIAVTCVDALRVDAEHRGAASGPASIGPSIEDSSARGLLVGSVASARLVIAAGASGTGRGSDWLPIRSSSASATSAAVSPSGARGRAAVVPDADIAVAVPWPRQMRQKRSLRIDVCAAERASSCLRASVPATSPEATRSSDAVQGATRGPARPLRLYDEQKGPSPRASLCHDCRLCERCALEKHRLLDDALAYDRGETRGGAAHPVVADPTQANRGDGPPSALSCRTTCGRRSRRPRRVCSASTGARGPCSGRRGPRVPGGW